MGGTPFITAVELLCEMLYDWSLTEDGLERESCAKEITNCIDNLTIALQKSQKGVFLSIVAIVRNEGTYIKEWIEYHRMLGVEHFYIVYFQ